MHARGSVGPSEKVVLHIFSREGGEGDALSLKLKSVFGGWGIVVGVLSSGGLLVCGFSLSPRSRTQLQTTQPRGPTYHALFSGEMGRGNDMERWFQRVEGGWLRRG